ncbi:MAG TPA: circularly permuted type 2 ATP-grasp protein [Candidatus Dormibacteraeota bacterium]|nr:circularly permuted type 2 ATP-grasp protein [Candidatus Dormibacteraeota bacterium]
MNLDTNYRTNGFYDEMLAAPSRPRPAYRRLYEALTRLGAAELQRRHALAMEMFRNHGITFAVYPDAQGTEKVFPFDVIPRVIEAGTWRRIEEGLKQRLRALNFFLDDVYGRKLILKQRAIPPEIVLSSSLYLREIEALAVPHGIHCHIAGIDLVRNEKGEFFVLEDNLRTPSGASYVQANRYVMKRVLPDLFAGYPVRPVEGYVHELLRHLRWLAPKGVDDPNVVLLTPGINNAAYYEHLYLAKQMGVELVQGSDLVVDEDHVFMRTTRGLTPVHVIYRRIDDEWLDPIFGRQESLVGVAGLINAYRAGNVAIANALGNGVADDKAVYALVPSIVKFYLDEDPILPNVETYLCAVESDRRYVVEHLENLVVKTVDASGGYGMLIGPASTKQEREEFRHRIQASPRSFIAQPVVALSVQPVFDGGNLRPGHQDLRPFILTGPDVYVTPGGLTRVALKPGSLVVNSSQGGGSRDTWVMAQESEDGGSDEHDAQ